MSPSALAHYWLIDAGLTYLNHGAFGSCPRSVLDFQTDLRSQMERSPIEFLDVELERRLDEARRPLASLVGAEPLDLTFVPNATTGVNTVLRSLELQPGDEILTTDHEYNACLNAARDVANRAGARTVVAQVPFPVADEDEVVDAIVSAATTRTRLAMLSHVTSPTAVVFPVARIAAALAERRIETLVDGAHAPGMVPIDIGALARSGVAYYAGNCHKWLCAPKGAGFLWVRPDRQAGIRPLVVSHAANSPRADRSLFLQQSDWTGTLDPTPLLAVPAAIAFLAGLHENGLAGQMAANHALAVEARELLRGALDTPPLAPTSMLGSMAAVLLPDGFKPAAAPVPSGAAPCTTYPVDPLRDILYNRYHIELPVFTWPPVPPATAHDRPRLRQLRISAQAYNVLADYERLAQALHELAATAGGR